MPYPEKPEFSFDTAQSYSVSFLQQLDGNLSLNEISINITSPITSITINSNSRQPLLVFGVRYREARRTRVTVQTRVILHPGSYNLLIEGCSTAEHVEGTLPDSDQVNWCLDKDFDINYPELLRSYIHYASTGDIRLFADQQEQWNPTMHGVGFTHYRHYYPVVRFKVGYMHSMFSQLKMKFIFDDETEELQDVTVQNNIFGETYLPNKAINWITVNEGSVPADSEIIFTQPLPKFGPVQVEILFDTPDGEEIKLDSWTCYLSRFTSFAQHLSWSQASLKTYYNSQGKQSQAGCAALPVQGHQPKFRYTPGNRMDSENTHSAKSGEMATTGVSEQPSVIKLENGVSAGTSLEPKLPYPDEYKEPPVSWRLSHSLVQHIGALDETSGTRFGRFAHATGVRFNDDASLTPLNGINDTVITTTIEGIADTKGRLYALWLRTTEPVDWRQVSADMTIHHIEPAEGCPISFAHREALSLDIDILPSADGASAFLIGLIDSIHTKLPRGGYALKLTFNAHQPGLPKLRPSTSIGSTLEVVTYRFIQPIGNPWPLPEEIEPVPGYFLEDLIELSEIDPRDIIRLWGGPAPAELINEIRTKISGQRIEQARSQDTPFLSPHFTNMANTLNYVKGQVDFISSKMPVQTFKSQTYVSRDSEVEPGKTPGKISDVDVNNKDLGSGDLFSVVFCF